MGYFFLSEPPDEPMPIPDFRTMGGKPTSRPSPDLFDTIYLCQRRQDWYREFAILEWYDPLPFIGSVTIASSVESVTAEIRAALKLDLDERRTLTTWTDALHHLIEMADALGVLVMVSGTVGNNTYRVLNPAEFRGFALTDYLAPLVFVNGADTKAAQIFTLAHELAHLWLGHSALSDSGPHMEPSHKIEAWCNRVAAELLVPLHLLRDEYHKGENLPAEISRLARRFKVSTLVILRRIYDAGGLTHDQFRTAYDAELEKLIAIPRRGSGGDFYKTQTVRVGKRFAKALVSSTLAGDTLYRDAFRLLCVSKFATFQKFADTVNSR